MITIRLQDGRPESFINFFILFNILKSAPKQQKPRFTLTVFENDSFRPFQVTGMISEEWSKKEQILWEHQGVMHAPKCMETRVHSPSSKTRGAPTRSFTIQEERTSLCCDWEAHTTAGVESIKSTIAEAKKTWMVHGQLPRTLISLQSKNHTVILNTLQRYLPTHLLPSFGKRFTFHVVIPVHYSGYSQPNSSTLQNLAQGLHSRKVTLPSLPQPRQQQQQENSNHCSLGQS